MKPTLLTLLVALSLSLTSCAVKYGCPSSGRNVGAEKLLSGNEKVVAKAMRKAPKFKQGKF